VGVLVLKSPSCRRQRTTALCLINGAHWGPLRRTRCWTARPLAQTPKHKSANIDVKVRKEHAVRESRMVRDSQKKGRARWILHWEQARGVGVGVGVARFQECHEGGGGELWGWGPRLGTVQRCSISKLSCCPKLRAQIPGQAPRLVSTTSRWMPMMLRNWVAIRRASFLNNPKSLQIVFGCKSQPPPGTTCYVS